MEETGGYPASKKQVRREGSYFLHSSLCFKIFILFKLEEKTKHIFLLLFTVAGLGVGESDRKHLWKDNRWKFPPNGENHEAIVTSRTRNMKKTSKHKIKLLTIVRKSKTFKSQRKKTLLCTLKYWKIEVIKLEFLTQKKITFKHTTEMKRFSRCAKA